MSIEIASAIVCENDEQLAKIAAIRDQLPNLRTVIVMDSPAEGHSEVAQALDAISLDEIRERGTSHTPEELDARRAAVRPEEMTHP